MRGRDALVRGRDSFMGGRDSFVGSRHIRLLGVTIGVTTGATYPTFNDH